MKIFHAIDEESSDISKEDKEKMAILKLVDVGKYIKGIGIRDGQFYVIAEDNADEVYLEYRQAMHTINVAFNKRIEPRLLMQKDMEFYNKRTKIVKRLMEMPK